MYFLFEINNAFLVLDDVLWPELDRATGVRAENTCRERGQGLLQLWFKKFGQSVGWGVWWPGGSIHSSESSAPQWLCRLQL